MDIRQTRAIDTVTHQYTGRQMLGRLLDFWAESIFLPIYLIAPAGEIDSRVNAIRVALAKERKRQHLNAHYGMLTSEPFKWTHRSNERADATVITWRQSRHQQLSQIWDIDIIGKRR